MESEKHAKSVKNVAESLLGKRKRGRGRPPSGKKKRPKPLPGMLRGARLTPEDEAVVQEVVTSPHLSLLDMAAKLNRSATSVRRHRKRIAAGLPIGGPRKPSQVQKERAEILKTVSDFMKAKPHSTSSDVENEIYSKMQLRRSRAAICAYLQQLGYDSKDKRWVLTR